MARAGSLGMRGKVSWRWLVGVAHTSRSTLHSPEWALQPYIRPNVPDECQ